MSVAIEKDVVSWDALEEMVRDLAGRLGADYDVLLAITRGGMVPAGMLAYRLGIRNILVAAVEYYDAEGHRARSRPSSSSRPIPSSAASAC